MATTYAGTPTAPTSITIVDDGDATSVANIAGALEDHQDFIKYLEARVADAEYYYEDPGGIAVGTTEGFTDATWDPDSGSPPAFSVQIPGCAVGDQILVMASFSYYNNGTPSAGGAQQQLRLSITEDYGGGSAATTTIPGARCVCGGGDTIYLSAGMSAVYTVTVAGTALIFLEGYCDGTHPLVVVEPSTLTALRLRG